MKTEGLRATSINTIQKRMKQAILGTLLSGAAVFSPMSGCELAMEGHPAAKGLSHVGRIDVTELNGLHWDGHPEAETRVPQDRVFFSYHHFHNAVGS
jgi:hypothetical protein